MSPFYTTGQPETANRPSFHGIRAGVRAGIHAVTTAAHEVKHFLVQWMGNPSLGYTSFLRFTLLLK
jgi:hypothetical protein